MRFIDSGFDNILLDEKSCKNILILNILYKTFMGKKLWRIWFGKIDGFITIDDGIRFLVLLKCNEIYDRIRYLINKKSGITDSINHNLARIRTDSYHSLPIEKILTFFNVIILLKSVVNEYENNYYCNIFWEKSLYKDKFTTWFF